jgi:hypothetical protein
LQLPISSSFGCNIERYEILDGIVEAEKSFQGVGPVEKREMAAMIGDALLKEYTIIYREGWHSATLRSDHRATSTQLVL